MAWFKKTRKPIEAQEKPSNRVPEGLWVKCPGCAQAIYNKDLAANLNVCPKCAHHFRVNATEMSIPRAAHRKLSFCAITVPPQSARLSGTILPG